MKPIIRFTIGQTSQEGIDCLRLSINNLMKLYNDEFAIYVCRNNIDVKKIKWLDDFPVKLLDQNEYKNSLKLKPINHPCWKLYPPRIDINNYEIFIDNDIVIHKKIDFFKNNKFFMSEAIKKSYGSFQNIINKEPHLNSGLFGIPPGFDFQKEINTTIEQFNVRWENSHFEEQAVVAHILNKNNCEVIDLNKVYVCYEDMKKAEYGFHFVGLNKHNYRFWKQYKKSIIF